MSKSRRDELMDKVFSLGGNHNLDEIQKLKEEILDYLKENILDEQVRDVLRFLEIYEEEANEADFELLCKIAEPMLDRIIDLDEWDIRDIELLSLGVAYAMTHEQAVLLFNQALRELEKYENHENYDKYIMTITAWLFSNVLPRLIRAVFNIKGTPAILGPQGFEINMLFKEIYENAIDFFEKNNLHLHRSVAIVRKGIFYDDKVFIKLGLSLLKEDGENEVYNMMLKEIEYYNNNKNGR